MLLIIITILLIILIRYITLKENDFVFDTVIDCSKVSVRKSEFGLGCFANRNFKKDEVIEIGMVTIMKGIDGNEYDHLFTWSEDRMVWAVGSGCLPFYNHSNEPNVVKIGDLKNDTMKVIALRDIKRDDELRNQYMSASWRTCFKDILM